jgi:hypothetical protein
MEIKTQITREDFLEFNKFVLLRNRLKKGFAIATIFILFWTIILNYNQPFNPITILIELIVFYIGWGILIFLLYKVNFQRIKKMPDQNGSILGDKTYILQDEGFKEITDSSETLTKWKGIKNIIETKNYTYVFVDKIAAYIIPKRNVDENNEVERFIKALKSKVGK